MRVLRLAVPLVAALYVSLATTGVLPAGADSSSCMMGVCLGDESKHSKLPRTQEELDQLIVQRGCDLNLDGSCDSRDPNYYYELQATLKSKGLESANTVNAPVIQTTAATTSNTVTTTSSSTQLPQSNTQTAATINCPAPVSGATGSGAAQTNYLLYNWDCDANKDRTCDKKDERIQQQQIQQQQQQAAQQGGGGQIAQQLAGLGQQLLGGLLGGGGGGGGGGNDPPVPPNPPAPVNPPNPNPNPNVNPNPQPKPNTNPVENPLDSPCKNGTCVKPPDNGPAPEDPNALNGQKDANALTDPNNSSTTEGAKETPERKEETPTPSPSPTATPTATPTPEKKEYPDTPVGQFDKLTDGPPQEAIKSSAKYEGMDQKLQQLGNPDPRQNPAVQRPEVQQELATLKNNLRDQVAAGNATPQDAAAAYANAEYAAHFQTSEGMYRDQQGFGSGWDPSKPVETRNAGQVIPKYHENAEVAQIVQTIKNENALLTDPRATYFDGRGQTRVDTVGQNFASTAMASVNKQGPKGSCWTCATEQFMYNNSADKLTAAQNDIFFNNQYVAPDGTKYTLSANEIYPDRSSQNWTVANGEHSYVNKVNQELIAHGAGYSQSGSGGDPNASYGALKDITGYSTIPQHSNNLNTITAIQNAGANTFQTYPFNGHAASNTGLFSYNPQTGKVDAYALGDNSWGPGNEVYVAATAENAGKIGFPGGGGSQFGSGLGGLGGLGNLLGGGGQGLGNTGQLNQQQQQQVQQYVKQQQQLEQEYRCLTTEQQNVVKSECSRIVSQTGGAAPSVCAFAFGYTTQNLTRAARALQGSRKRSEVQVERF